MVAAVCLISGLPACLVSAQQPQPISGWRGDGSGVFAGDKVATEWSSDKKQNVLWSTQVGSAYSSPVVVKAKGGERVLMTSEPDKIVCVDGATGKVLWDKASRFKDLPAELNVKEQEMPSQVGYAAATPVSDGEHVWAVFGTGVVACYDLEGKREWITFLERDGNEYGRSASPALVGRGDGKEGVLAVPMQYVTGLDPKTGKVLWTNDKAETKYGSVIGAKVGKMDVIVTPRGDILRAKDGKIVAAEVAATAYATPVVSGDVFYWVGNDATAVRVTLKGEDEVTTKELWDTTVPEAGDIFSSPVVADGKVYAVNGRGNLMVFDAKSGAVAASVALKIDPMGREGGDPMMYASLGLAGSKLFAMNNKGDTAVLETKPELTALHENSLDGQIMASAAWREGRMFVRSGDVLYCIGAK